MADFEAACRVCPFTATGDDFKTAWRAAREHERAHGGHICSISPEGEVEEDPEL